MTIIFKLASGDIIETDTPEEAKEIAAMLQLNSAQTQSNSNSQPPNTTRNNNQMIPSVSDFIKAFKNQELKKVLRFIANQTNNGIISKNDLVQNTGKNSLSGMGKLFSRLTGGASLSSLIRKEVKQDIYQVDQSAHTNLIQAFKNIP